LPYHYWPSGCGRDMWRTVPALNSRNLKAAYYVCVDYARNHAGPPPSTEYYGRLLEICCLSRHGSLTTQCSRVKGVLSGRSVCRLYAAGDDEGHFPSISHDTTATSSDLGMFDKELLAVRREENMPETWASIMNDENKPVALIPNVASLMILGVRNIYGRNRR
jgi:hypothetical protein